MARVLYFLFFSFLYLNQSWAAPSSVFDSADPISSDSIPTAESIGISDSNVSTQTGAFEYSYPISVPPGRGGATPNLTLRYSSQGALYGTFAAGWTLQLPEIRFDPKSTELHWKKKGPLGTWLPHKTSWISSLSGNQRLLLSFQPKADDVDATYRARVDSSYIRYEKLKATEDAAWRARTLDGTVYTFAEASKMDHSRTSRAIGFFPITSMTDIHGNTVEYFWRARKRDNVIVDFDINKITYSTNKNDTTLEPFAEILFNGNNKDCRGTKLPIGSQLDMGSGQRWERGGRKITSIQTMAKNNDGSGMRRVRLIKFNYDNEAENCRAEHAPIRVLTSIKETAISPEGKKTSLPAVSFEYGPLRRSLKHTSSALTTIAAYGDRQGLGEDSWPNLKSMLIDFDGDGLTDKLTINKLKGNSNEQCTASLHLNIGGAFTEGIEIPFPTMKWHSSLGPNINKETCSLTAQYSDFFNLGNSEESEAHIPFNNSKQCRSGSYLVYKFADVHGDGLPDLIVAAHHAHIFNPNLGDHLPYKVRACEQEAACPGFDFWRCSAERVECTLGLSGKECPDPFLAYTACQQATNSVACGAKLYKASGGLAIPENAGDAPCSCTVSIEGGGERPCDQEETQDNCNCVAISRSDGTFECDAHFEPFPPGSSPGDLVDALKPNQIPQCPPIGAHTKCGRYPWAIYKNTGQGFDLANPHYTLSPIPLESNGDGAQFGPTTRGFFW